MELKKKFDRHNILGSLNKGLKTHSILPSLVQTAKRQKVHPLTFLKTLLTADPASAQAALYNNSS